MSPQTRKQWRRFRSIKRGYYSLLALLALLVACAVRRAVVNSRALVVNYHGELLLPDVRRVSSPDDLRPRL